MAFLDRPLEPKPIGLDRHHLWLALGLAVITALLLGALFAARFTLFTSAPPTADDLAQGKASPLTILAPDRITYVSALDTAHAQDQAAAAVADVYDPPDANVDREQVRRAARLIAFLDTVRADPYGTLQEKVDWVEAVPGAVIPREIVSRTLVLDSTSYRQVISETLYVLDQSMRDEIRETDLDAAKKKVTSRVSLTLSADQSNLVTGWAQPFIVPNTTLNLAKTDEARQQARDGVAEVYRTIEKGQALVRAGEVITPETYEALRELGYLQPQNDFQETAAAFLFAGLLVTLGAVYLIRIAPDLLREPRVLLILSLLLLVMALGAKIAIPGRTILPYLFPFAAAGLLGAALLSAEVGAGLAVLVGLSVGYLSRGSIELGVLVLVGGLVAAVTLKQRERLTSFLVTGLYVALANVALVLIFRLLARDDDLANVARLALVVFAGGILTGLIALGSQFLLGKLAGLTTALELIELARPTHPLMQKLLREAPGTYHHSLIISNLSEQAAQRIGADSLLCRVGAYYHDVGKTLNPQFFVENQFDGANPHNTLDPRASTAILHAHVTDGLMLAKKYRVSKPVRDFISQHHGTTLPVYFFEKAQAQSPGELIDENEFRYPGTKPQTREAAIMMLADGVEATTRAERPANPQEIRSIIDRITEQRIEDGQLDEAAITLRDLEMIKQSFVQVLQGLYHPRVRYPAKTPRDLPAPVPVGAIEPKSRIP